MNVLVFSFVVSLVLTLLIVKSSARHGVLFADHHLTGPQKFHTTPVPRIGGLSVAIAMLASTGLVYAGALDTNHTSSGLLPTLLLCATPAFVSGFAEDLTKSVSPNRRLVCTALSAALGIWLLDGVIHRTDLPGLDTLVLYAPFAIALTIFMVTGVANAVNIIDGFNGLAAMCVMMMLAALAYVASQVGDSFIVMAALITLGAVLGFFVWNFPAGLIFLGDGGAYLLGFVFGELSVLLIARNKEVSPLFPILLCAYPIFETIFSIYRKKFLRGMSPGVPDGIHLHMLIYKRLMRWTLGTSARQQTVRNSMTSPYLWLLCLMSVIPAVLNWNNTTWLVTYCLLFAVSYIFLYWRIVRFKVPKWMVVRR